MTIYSLKHEGRTLRQLKNIVAYNTNDKDGLNDNFNPRLIGVESNIGFCSNVNDKKEYNELTDNFILSVESNAQLSKNNRQKYLYEHSVVSFSRNDDEILGIDKMKKIVVETAKIYDPNFENTPYIIWPQVDSGKLHFHIVRGYHDENGNYHRKEHAKRRMQAAAQKIEKKHKLTLTGRNDPKNYFWKMDKNGNKSKIYLPIKSDDNIKVNKNRIKENQAFIDYNGNVKYSLVQDVNKEKREVKKQKEIISHNKKSVENKINKKFGEIKKLEEPIKYSFFQRFKNQFTDQVEIDRNYKKEVINSCNENVNDLKIKYVKDIKSRNNNIKSKNNFIDKRKKEIKEFQNEIDEGEAKNKEIIKKDEMFNSFKNKVNTFYRSAKTSKEFVKKLNDNGIEISVIKRENGNGGITFTDLNNDLSLSGSKINSYLSYGKMKKNDKDLFDLIHDYSSNKLRPSGKNNYDTVEINKINNNYKQVINTNGETLIYYSKKDDKSRPENYNLKLSQGKDSISFGQNSNDYDIKLAYECAKTIGWKSAVSDNKELVLNAMKIAYKENKDDLLFFKTTKKLTIKEIKEVMNGERLKTKHLNELLDNDMLHEKDANRVKEELKTRSSIQEESFDYDEPIKNSIKVRLR